MEMNVVYATSDKYSRLALVSLKSFLMNNTKAEKINIYYIGNHLSEKNKGCLSDLADEYSRKIFFLEMPERFTSIDGTIRTDPVVYSYCFFQDILPQTVDKVLLLESDMITLKDARALYSTDLTGYYLAAVDDVISPWYKKWLDIPPDRPYFNCGMLLLNLKMLREEQASAKLEQIITSGKYKFFYEAQDELNVFCGGKVKIIPPEFNAVSNLMAFDDKGLSRLRGAKISGSPEEYNTARNDPVIVHFTKTVFIQPHPWRRGCNHPYKEVYQKIKSETAGSGDPLWEKIHSLGNLVASFIYRYFGAEFAAGLFGPLLHVMSWFRLMRYRRRWK